MDALGVKKCHIAGNSLGGEVVWQFTAAYPEMVEKLILSDSAGYVFEMREGAKSLFLIRKYGKKFPVKYFIRYNGNAKINAKEYAKSYHDKTRLKLEVTQLYFDMSLRTGNRQALIERMTGRWDDSEIIKLTTITAPTLIIWGKHDDVVPTHLAERFKKDIPNSTLAIIDDAGHVPMEETPEQFVQLVNDFLK